MKLPFGRRISGVFPALGLCAFVLSMMVGGVSAHDAPPADQELASVPQGPDESIHYVGIVDDSEIYVAVINQGHGVFDLYLCDGTDLSVWFEGSGDEQTGTFAVAATDGSEVTGTVKDATATGEVTLAAGTVLTFTATKADLPAGFYTRVAIENGESVQARTIVLSNGSSKGKKIKFDCAGAEGAYEFYMDKYRNAVSGSNAAWLAGNDAHEIYVKARQAGCAWAAWPTT